MSLPLILAIIAVVVIIAIISSRSGSAPRSSSVKPKAYSKSKVPTISSGGGATSWKDGSKLTVGSHFKGGGSEIKKSDASSEKKYGDGIDEQLQGAKAFRTAEKSTDNLGKTWGRGGSSKN